MFSIATPFRFLLVGLWLSTAILITACKDDDPAPQTQTGALVGQATPATALTVVTATAASGQQYTASLDAATGAFAFVTLPVGTYTVTFTPAAGYRAPASQTATVTVNHTTTLPAVTVLPDYSITGQVQPAGSVTLVTATAANGQTYTIVPGANGTYAFTALSPGSYIVSYAVASGYLPASTQTAIVTANATTPVPGIVVLASKPALLTGHRWRIVGQQITDNSTGTVTDFYGNSPTCFRDNYYAFNADGTTLFDEGASKCASTDPQTATGTWELLNNYTQLRMTFDSSPAEIQEVVELTGSSLHLRQSVGGSTLDSFFGPL
jgi:hypothetical protein